MKKQLLFAAFFAFAQLAQAQYLDTVRIKATGLDGNVAISTDDAEQINNEIDKLYDDDLDMGWEGDEFNVVITGLRFQNVNVPKGAKIDSAFVEIYAHEDEGDLAKVTIKGEASDNAVTYNETDLITARPVTAAVVSWNITEEWAIWEKYRTPEIKTIIQEIVNRQGWQPGNALALSFVGEDQGASTEDNARDFESLENVEDPDDGGDGLNHPERIPKLFIYYSLPSGTNAPKALVNIAVQPNPVTNGAVHIDLNAFAGENVQISITDMTGRQVLSQKAVANGPWVLQLPAGLARGIYSLDVQSGDKIANTQISVQ